MSMTGFTDIICNHPGVIESQEISTEAEKLLRSMQEVEGSSVHLLMQPPAHVLGTLVIIALFKFYCSMIISL